MGGLWGYRILLGRVVGLGVRVKVGVVAGVQVWWGRVVGSGCGVICVQLGIRVG